MSTPAHASGETTSVTQTEPVNVVQLVHLVLAALVTLGWVNIDSALIDTIGTVVAGLISVGAQYWARSKVVPVAKVAAVAVPVDPPDDTPGASKVD